MVYFGLLKKFQFWCVLLFLFPSSLTEFNPRTINTIGQNTKFEGVQTDHHDWLNMVHNMT